MIQTNRPFLAENRYPVFMIGDRQNRRWSVHILFALAYVVAVLISISAVYSGTFIAIAWPPIGVAVWWAVSCRYRGELLLLSVFVFFIHVIYMGVWAEHPFLQVVLSGTSHVIAGPGIAILMALLKKTPMARSQRYNSARFTPSARMITPREIYMLLIASLIMIPIAKGISMIGFAVGGSDTSITLFLSLILRDLAGVIAIVGPGITIYSAAWRGVDATAIREFVGVIMATVILLALIFGPGRELPITYLAMLPLYWSATRLPVSMASVHAVLTASAATFLAYWFNAGPFAISGAPIAQASASQLFIIMCILLSLVVSTKVQQHAALAAELEVLTETIPDPLLTIDRGGQAVPVNLAADDLVVRDPDGNPVMRGLRKVGGVPLTDSLEPSDRALQGETVREILVELSDIPADGADDDRSIFSVSASPLFLPGEVEPVRAVLLYRDVTDGYRAMQQLQQAHDEAQHLFEHAPQGVATLDETGIILQANSALGELIGLPAEYLPGRRLDDFSMEDDLWEEIRSALKEPGTLVHTDRCLGFDEEFGRRVALSFRTIMGGNMTPPLLLVNAVDVTERQKLHELVSHLADHDALTGLVNRRRVETEFEEIFERSARELNDGAVLLIDLDNFKLVNDHLGHHVGDELLVEFAGVLTDSVRTTDVVGRIGGDEFIVILPDTDRAETIAIGERIVNLVRHRFKDRTNVLRGVTASIGIIMFSEAREEGVDPFILADQLLYEAKRLGRNRLATLKPGGEIVSSVTSQLSRGRLEEILSTDGLRLELQPIAEMTTGRIVLAEGLARVSISGTRVETGEFVAAVERAGLGPILDAHVLRQGIRLLPELQRARPGFRLTLNLSAQSLGSEEISRVVISELEKHQILPGSLVLEVTETAPVEDIDTARTFQRALHEHGVVLALDDFGAGFDPYRYLKQLDFDIMKISGEFVEGVVSGGVDLSIVRSLICLAQEQGMSTVAEFVSNEKIFDALQPLGVTYAQGYHIGCPHLPKDFIARYLSEPEPSTITQL